MKYNIVLFTLGLEFNGATLEKTALGGSETAFIYLAKEFARLGHKVRAFCNCPEEGNFDGVQYMNQSRFSDFMLTGECDIFICSRFASVFSNPINAKLRILWNHDIMTTPNSVMPFITGIDYMYCLSDYHKRQYLKVCHDLEPLIKTTTNAVDHSLIPKNSVKKHQIMFTSRPERGLENALMMYKELGDKSLKFIICNYKTIESKEVSDVEQRCLFFVNQLLENGFDIELGRFTKEELYKKISESKAVIYPSGFPEISCISAMEAQACGTAFLCFDKYALSETVGTEKARDENHLFDMFKKVISDEGYRQTLEKIGFEHAQKYAWSAVASQFLNDAKEYFFERAKNNTGILNRLVYESDILAAIKYAEEFVPGRVDELKSLIAHTETKEGHESFYSHDRVLEAHDKLPENQRLKWIADKIEHNSIRSVIDYGCNAGYTAAHISRQLPGCKILGFDISKKAIEFAQKYSGKNVKFTTDESELKKFSNESLPEALILAEVLEHVQNPSEFIDSLEEYLPNGSLIVMTLPKGAWEWLSRRDRIEKGFVEHVSGFNMDDIEHMFSLKDDLQIDVGVIGVGLCGERLGHYLITYRTNGKPTLNCDYGKKFKLSRPYQRISACIIAKNAQKDIEHCLDSIKDVVDEIIVLDDKSSDDTAERARKYTDKVFIAEKTIGAPDMNGFANARNATVEKATGDWVLWIDTDERLYATVKLRQHLDTPLINGFVIAQHHAQLDNFIEADKPQRLFRRGTGQFVGYIHEQPMSMTDINSPIVPGLIIGDAKIAHFGAIDEATRRNKCLNRNLPLLEIDHEKSKGRLMTDVLIMRDFVNRIKWSYEHYRTFVNPDSLNVMGIIKKLWDEKFKDCKDQLHRNEAFKIIQEAMELTETGFEIKYGIAINPGRTNDEYLPGLQKIRVFEEELPEFFKKMQEASTKTLHPESVVDL